MTKNQSLPARLREKNSQGEHDLTMYEHHKKPTKLDIFNLVYLLI